MIKLKMKNNINREAAKISVLSSGKIHKYEYLIGEDILPSNQQQIIEQAKFTYSPLGKGFEKQIKTIKDQGEEQVEVLNTLKPDNKLPIEDVIQKSAFDNDEAKKELNKVKEIEKYIDREKLFYKSNKNTYDFRKFQTIRNFGKDIYECEIILEEADKNQSDLTNEIKNFNDKARPKSYKKKQEKEDTLDSLSNFFNAREMVLNGFKSKIFLINLKDQVF